MIIGIIADDLTGAADSVAPFARRGFQASVGFGTGEIPSFPMIPGNALAFNTETRDSNVLSASHIVHAVRTATRQLLAQQPSLLFKKIDSTLRGHLRLELETMRAELPGRIALICPAFPANGRTVKNGNLFLQERLWIPAEGASSPTVCRGFEYQNARNSGTIEWGILQQGIENLEARVNALASQGVDTLFIDAVRQSDLEILAQLILRQPERYLPVGSAGLATALAHALPSPVGAKQNTVVEVGGNMLLVVGSKNPVSRQQRDYLATQAGISPLVIGVDSSITESGKRLLHQWDTGQRLALLTTPEDESTANLSQRLGLLATWLFHHCVLSGVSPFQSLVLTGGETAIHWCKAFQAHGLHILGEPEPGIVTGKLALSPQAEALFAPLTVTTKAGGFGDIGTLARCTGLE